MVKRKKPRRRQSRHAFPVDAATRETRAKLKRDTVQELAYRKKLTPSHEQAAREIDAVFYARTSMLWAKTQDLNRQPGPASNRDWPASLQAAAQRYDAWANKLSAEHHNGGPPLLEITIAIIIDGWSGNDVDTSRRQRKGTASKWLIEALQKYVEISGWSRKKEGVAA